MKKLILSSRFAQPIYPGLYDLCLNKTNISGEPLQDKASSGFHYKSNFVKNHYWIEYAKFVDTASINFSCVYLIILK